MHPEGFKNLFVWQVTDSLENVNLPELIDGIIALYPAQAKGPKLTIEVDIASRVTASGWGVLGT